jgi:23S rRNA pseudouridine1911/1915/1917 synthase
LLFALEKKLNESLGKSFRERRVKKEYLAWVEGLPKVDSWTSDSEIGKVGGKYRAVGTGEGKEAQTLCRVLRREEDRALILASPLTGRTHQIRIHLAEAGHPVLGDPAYGAKPDKRLYLHAWRLTLKHPILKKLISFEAPVPAEMMISDQ